MLQPFETAVVSHTSGPNRAGDAARRVLTSADFDAAIGEISSWEGYAPTPLVELDHLAETLGIEKVIYKHEGPRFGLGSFKALGGSYAAFRLLQREFSQALGRQVPLADVTNPEYAEAASKITLITATDGNHGRSVAWGARRLGTRSRIYIHAEVSEGRAQAMRDLGAEVIRIDGDYDATVEVTRRDAKENGWFIVSDTSWPGYSEIPRDVMAGYGVMAQEINSELDIPPTHVFLQGGVGGLAASVAAALRQRWGADSPRVVVVEPDLAPCLLASAKTGDATPAPISEETMMAGLSCGEPSKIAWDILADEVRDFITIPESVVAPAVKLMARPEGGDPVIEAGESAIAGLAGLICAARQDELRAKINLDAASRVLLIGTEGVTDPMVYAKILEAA